MSLNVVVIQTETGVINIQHLFENLKKDTATNQQLEGKLKGCVRYIFNSLFCMSKREDL